MTLAQRLALAAAAAVSATALAQPAPSPAQPTGPIHVLLLTGQNNHNWRYTSRYHKDTLEETGRFVVDVTDDPAAALADTGRLAGYQVLVLDYNDQKRWGEPAETNFLNAVKGGAGVVLIHAADNAFVGWTEYETLAGLMWIEGTTSHGDFHPFDVNIVDREHPITRGLSDFKAHPDELYHRLVNTQNAKYHLLAHAMSSAEHRGTGQNEPMALTLEYGKGRVFATPLGHVWQGSDDQKASIADPQFKILLARGTEWAATGNSTISGPLKDVRPHNQLTAEEKAAGWKLLFDGSTMTSWRGYKQKDVPKAWIAKDGMLWRQPGEAGPDLVTADEFGDFELALDWRISKGGNSGIIWRSTEDHGASWETGPEMQVLDNPGFKDSQPKNKAGALYDLVPCAYDVARNAGEWNHARVKAVGSKTELWLNGFKVVDTDTTSEDFKKALAASKWTHYPEFNTRPKGHIALQDHDGEVCFRDIKIREIK